MQSKLTVSPETNPAQSEVFTDFDAIRKKLVEVKVGYERWQAEKPLNEKATPEDSLFHAQP